MISDKVEAGDLRDRPKHRSSYSTVEEDLAGGTVVMDGTALAAIDDLLSRNAISKAPRAAGYRGSDFVVCPACSIAWGRKSPVQPDGGEGLSEAQGCHREVASEGSVEQSRDPTNRNRIRGIPGRTSGQRIAKSISIKGQGCRSGGGAVKAIELTWGGLRPVP
jgi:hypothetical protein